MKSQIIGTHVLFTEFPSLVGWTMKWNINKSLKSSDDHQAFCLVLQVQWCRQWWCSPANQWPAEFTRHVLVTVRFAWNLNRGGTKKKGQVPGTVPSWTPHPTPKSEPCLYHAEGKAQLERHNLKDLQPIDPTEHRPDWRWSSYTRIHFANAQHPPGPVRSTI